ncbi:hypothetical protein D9757_002570 [Collybiopsis confluens]|uniref:Uncharacterized protein n=1 Tax=Collybiopsis confluens TaxID=2823264 RepID=A0A8H5ME95_9AGAR|nr:hypothetical protein D9757_002570 [Collybiopsis confluens]
MKFSLAIISLLVAVASARSRKQRDDGGSVVAQTTATATDAPLTLTATKVFHTVMDEPPYMTAVTMTTVWTQFPASSSA